MLQLYYKRTSFELEKYVVEQIIVSEIIRPPLMFCPFRQLVQCLFATNGDQFIEMNEPEGNAFTISKTKIGTAAQANCTIRLAVSQSVRRRLCKAEM